jgi:hypothetical protein
MPTRRQFHACLLAAPFLAALRQARAFGAEEPSLVRATLAAGELGARIRLTADRLVHGGPPAFTREFILADVTLEGDRRFAEFSGDLSGRYLGALALLPPQGLDLRPLARDLLKQQRADGRFGNASLAFTPADIGPAHMALLWGNGRLLVGLLEYAEATGDAEAVAGARRLGDFLAGVQKACAAPEVAHRLSGEGAMGFICFTQLAEGFVLLSEATDDRRYLETARSVGALLGPRGIQHAHGYLTTLRGLALLAQATGDATVLHDVESRYRDLVASSDLSPYGGVLEYFGWDEPQVSEDERRRLLAQSGGAARDEGCAVADFLRLSLQLWRATGTLDYLERAERCLLNQFFFNQWSTGDFGHHVLFPQGFRPTESVGRGWWCCTMHGYRAFRDVLDQVVRREKGMTFVDLMVDADVTFPGLSLSLRHTSDAPGQSRFRVEVQDASLEPQGLSFRRPSWANSTLVLFGDHKTSPPPGPSFTYHRQWRAGETVEMIFEHAVRLETRDRRFVPSASLPADAEALLFVGPWLMAVDDATDPPFFSEPWTSQNTVFLPPTLAQAEAGEAGGGPFTNPARHLGLKYTHGGFPGTHPVTLRPLSEQTALAPGTVATWLRYRSPT